MQPQDSTIDIQDLECRARLLRAKIIENSHKSKTPHLGSCLSCIDILVAIYFSALKVNPYEPNDPERDRFILSKGHGAPALFHVLAMSGFYPERMLQGYGENGGLFAEHPPTPDRLAGLEAATGSLGHGLPIGVGMAMAARIHSKDYKVIALLSDGECNEGSIWEAAMFAAGQKIENLAAIIDYNKWQATGRSREVMALSPLAEKWRAFGWSTSVVDGHDIQAMTELFSRFPDGSGKPVAIVAHTIKGKGVSFMEDDNNWHYRIPTAEEVLKAKIELGILL